MHQAGAFALTKLLRYDPPDADRRTVPCPCGRSAHYKELRSKTVLTVLGPVELRRPYHVCADCSKGQYPADAELGVAGLESSPGVRRDRKSTRLNSSHQIISYAVFCLK